MAGTGENGGGGRGGALREKDNRQTRKHNTKGGVGKRMRQRNVLALMLKVNESVPRALEALQEAVMSEVTSMRTTLTTSPSRSTSDSALRIWYEHDSIQFIVCSTKSHQYENLFACNIHRIVNHFVVVKLTSWGHLGLKSIRSNQIRTHLKRSAFLLQRKLIKMLFPVLYRSISGDPDDTWSRETSDITAQIHCGLRALLHLCVVRLHDLWWSCRETQNSVIDHNYHSNSC